MTYGGSWGHQVVQGGKAAPGGSRQPPAPKRVKKQQNHGPKPWFKIPKVCPDPKGMVFTHLLDIWGHLGALQQQYLVKTPICQNADFGTKKHTKNYPDHQVQFCIGNFPSMLDKHIEKSPFYQ